MGIATTTVPMSINRYPGAANTGQNFENGSSPARKQMLHEHEARLISTSLARIYRY